MILLDTNALIRLTEAIALRADATAAIIDAADTGRLAVSATSAWEVGLLATRTGTSRLIFAEDARRWFARAVERMRLIVLPMSAEILLEAADLPGDLHKDPSDRWIVAAARYHDATVITSDRRILAYAEAGHVQAISA